MFTDRLGAATISLRRRASPMPMLRHLSNIFHEFAMRTLLELNSGMARAAATALLFLDDDDVLSSISNRIPEVFGSFLARVMRFWCKEVEAA